MFSTKLKTASIAVRAIGVALVAASTILSLPSTVHAAQYTHRDAVRDVVLGKEGPHPTEFKGRPRERRGDITRLVVDHRRDALTIRLEFRDLPRRGVAFMTSEVVTPHGRFEADVYRNQRGKVDLIVSDGSLNDPCPRATWRYSTRRNIVSISLPTRCLGNPRWVRVGAGYSWDTLIRRARFFADDARRSRGVRESEPALGPRVHRS